MLLDVMDNLPRCRFSSAQMLSKDAANLSSFGNIFYMNDIRETLARIWPTRFVAQHMHFYPEETDGPISEVYQAERLDGRWKHLEKERTIKADDLELDYNDMIAHFGELVWTDDTRVSMPNEMRKLVGEDEDLFVVMAAPWADDVSGNKSKQYNKHMNMYTGNGCLPGRLLQQEYHVHYVSTSPNASSAEQFSAFRDHVRSTEKEPVRCYNAATNRVSRFIIRVPGLPADNPQQSEEHPIWAAMRTSLAENETEEIYHQCHLAGAARDAGEIRESLEEQLRLSMLGDPKAVTEHQRATGTKDKVAQYWIDILLAKSQAMKAENRQRKEDDIALELKTWLDSQPGDKMNPLLNILGLDPAQDTPVELLHTILLGVIKYIWHHLNTNRWSDEDRHLLAIRLQSTDLTGLTVPPVRAGYMIQYKNNLIGKHFKTLMQILAFHLHGISTPEEFALVKAAGDLGARLWVPEIDDMDQYLDQLKIAVANLLDAFDDVDPSRILVKIKLHLLAHLPDDVRRFGPLVRWATEIYESYNGVFRLCSIFSNRLAPSRDISTKFASMDRVKHFLSGGYWWEVDSGRWTQSGREVQQVLLTDPVFQRHLGWTPPPKIKPGLVNPMPANKNPPVKWNQTKAAGHWITDSPPTPDSQWRMGRAVTAQSGDKAVIGTWVFAKNPAGATVIGRVAELLVGSKSIATLEQFICTDQLHAEFGWPVLRRPNGAEITAGRGESHIALDSKTIQFVCSVQHDCRMGNCKPGISRKERQEREDTNRDTMLIKHADDDQFVLNMGGLHNFAKLCRALPQSLTQLTLLHEDRIAFHKEMAVKAGSTRTKKRKRTADKRRETAAAKRREAEQAAAEAEKAAAEAEAALEQDNDDEEDTEPEGNEGEGFEAPDFDHADDSEAEDDNQVELPPTRKRRRKRARNH
ncbi:hypothetical protein B0H12DRAFT_1254515 [Mycena haematopus]|nr:hypothetical protein B0H12DRAFT_1254515 [Mycena haematopus]